MENRFKINRIGPVYEQSSVKMSQPKVYIIDLNFT